MLLRLQLAAMARLRLGFRMLLRRIRRLRWQVRAVAATEERLRSQCLVRLRVMRCQQSLRMSRGRALRSHQSDTN